MRFKGFKNLLDFMAVCEGIKYITEWNQKKCVQNRNAKPLKMESVCGEDLWK